MSMSAVGASRTSVVLLLALSGFASSANLRMLDAALPTIAAEFDVSVGKAATVSTAYALSYGLLQILFGVVGDRMGKYRLLTVLCGLSCLATLASTLAGSLDQLILARFAAGAAASAIIPMSMAWMGDMIPLNERQEVLARYMSGSILGLLFGQIIGGIVTEYSSWRMAPAAVATVYLLVAISLVALSRHSPWILGNKWAAADSLSARQILGRVFGVAWSLKVLLAVSLEGVAVFGAMTFIGAALNYRFGANLALVGVILAFYAVGGIVYSWAVSHLLAKLGGPNMFVIMSVFACGGLLLLAGSGTIWTAPLAVALIGLGASGMHNGLQVHATQLLPEARATGFSFFATCFFLSQSLGIALAAPVVDRFNAEPVFVASGLLILGLGLWFAPQMRANAGSRH